MTSIQFDSTELANATYIPQYVKHETAPERELATYPMPRDDGDAFVSERYGQKPIQLKGILVGTSQADLESKIDAFKELLSRPQKNLDIDWNGGTRRYVATCKSHEFDRDHFNIGFVPWTAEFVVFSGEGKDTTTTTAPGADGLTGTRLIFNPPTAATAAVTIAGGKPPRPVITLSNLDCGSAVQGIEYKNVDTGERMVITYDGSWGDDRTIIIDCDARTVTGDVVNGVMKPLRWYGVFPRFKIGTNNLTATFGYIVNQKSADDSVSELASSSVLIQSTNDVKAQSFMVGRDDATFLGVQLAVFVEGTPGNLIWRIETDNGGKPSGTLVDANATGNISYSNFSAVAKAYAVIGQGTGGGGTSTFQLRGNVVYWLVVKANATLNGSNRYTLGLAGLGTDGYPTYPRGRMRYSIDGASTWTDFSSKTDLSFQILMGGKQANMAPYHLMQYSKTYL